MVCHRFKFAPAKIIVGLASFERIQCNHQWTGTDTDQKAIKNPFREQKPRQRGCNVPIRQAFSIGKEGEFMALVWLWCGFRVALVWL